MNLINQLFVTISLLSLADAVLFQADISVEGVRETKEVKGEKRTGGVRGRRAPPPQRKLKQAKEDEESNEDCTIYKFDLSVADAQENKYTNYDNSTTTRVPGDFDAITIPLYEYNTKNQVGIFMQSTQYIPSREGIGTQIYSLDFDDDLGEYKSVVSASATASSHQNGIYAGSGRFAKAHGFVAGFTVEERGVGEAVSIPMITVCKD